MSKHKNNWIWYIILGLIVYSLVLRGGFKLSSVLPAGLSIPSNAKLVNDWHTITTASQDIVYSIEKGNPIRFTCGYDYCEYRITDSVNIKECCGMLQKGQTHIVDYWQTGAFVAYWQERDYQTIITTTTTTTTSPLSYQPLPPISPDGAKQPTTQQPQNLLQQLMDFINNIIKSILAFIAIPIIPPFP